MLSNIGSFSLISIPELTNAALLRIQMNKNYPSRAYVITLFEPVLWVILFASAPPPSSHSIEH